MCDIYVDDTSVVNIGNNHSSTDIQVVADEISRWSSNNKMQLNACKTKELLVNFSRVSSIILSLTDNQLSVSQMLRCWVSQSVTIWNGITMYKNSIKSSQRLVMLSQLKKAGLPWKDMLTIYISKIQSIVE